MRFGVLTITEFCRKYRLSEDAKTELITMQAFHQRIAMVIGMAITGIWYLIMKLVL